MAMIRIYEVSKENLVKVKSVLEAPDTVAGELDVEDRKSVV